MTLEPPPAAPPANFEQSRKVSAAENQNLQKSRDAARPENQKPCQSRNPALPEAQNAAPEQKRISHRSADASTLNQRRQPSAAKVL